MTSYRRRREALGIKQAALADKIGISVQALQRIEYGMTLPSVQTWFRLNNVLSGKMEEDLHDYVWDGEQLRRLRKMSRITQTELGKKIEASALRISCWENGEQPRLTYLIRICEFFGVKMDLFFISKDHEYV